MRSKRRTSKIVLIVNTALAWGLAYYGVATGQAAAVVAAALALVGSLYGAYVGVGHLDYRQVLHNLTQGTPNAPSATLEADPDGDASDGPPDGGLDDLPKG